MSSTVSRLVASSTHEWDPQSLLPVLKFPYIPFNNVIGWYESHRYCICCTEKSVYFATLSFSEDGDDHGNNTASIVVTDLHTGRRIKVSLPIKIRANWYDILGEPKLRSFGKWMMLDCAVNSGGSHWAHNEYCRYPVGLDYFTCFVNPVTGAYRIDRNNLRNWNVYESGLMLMHNKSWPDQAQIVVSRVVDDSTELPLFFNATYTLHDDHGYDNLGSSIICGMAIRAYNDVFTVASLPIDYNRRPFNHLDMHRMPLAGEHLSSSKLDREHVEVRDFERPDRWPVYWIARRRDGVVKCVDAGKRVHKTVTISESRHLAWVTLANAGGTWTSGIADYDTGKIIFEYPFADDRWIPFMLVDDGTEDALSDDDMLVYTLHAIQEQDNNST
jgi:hypothetical protein